MTCKHSRTTCGANRCYTGGVAVHPYTDENSAAHGGVTYAEECDQCGARRSVNANGCHVEVSPWGETRAARRAEVDRVRRAKPKRPATIYITSPSGHQLSVSVSPEDGMLDIVGEHKSRDLVAVRAALAGTEFAEAAKQYRQWSLDLATAVEVAS
jgi:hypothetical protein